MFGAHFFEFGYLENNKNKNYVWSILQPNNYCFWIMRLFICDDVNFLRATFPRSETDGGDDRIHTKWPSGPTGRADDIFPIHIFPH